MSITVSNVTHRPGRTFIFRFPLGLLKADDDVHGSFHDGYSVF